MTHSDKSCEISRLEALTARTLPPEVPLDAGDEAARAAFLAWAAELEQQASTMDPQTVVAALQARLSRVPSEPPASPFCRKEHAARLEKGRIRAMLLAAGSLSVALAIVLAYLSQHSHVPLAAPRRGGPQLADLAHARSPHTVSSPAGLVHDPAPAERSGHGAGAGELGPSDALASEPAVTADGASVGWQDRSDDDVDGTSIPPWEDTLDAELWWARQVLVDWTKTASRVDGRLARMGSRLVQLQQELAGDSL
jgi:hypothetical protein